jgi:hypothetical protein
VKKCHKGLEWRFFWKTRDDELGWVSVCVCVCVCVFSLLQKREDNRSIIATFLAGRGVVFCPFRCLPPSCERNSLEIPFFFSSFSCAWAEDVCRGFC